MAGGVAGLAALMVSSSLVPGDAMNDNVRLVAQITDKKPIVWLTQVLCVVAAAGLMIFGSGLRRKLQTNEPAGSLLPTVAHTGVVVTAAAVLIGGGMCTELFWDLANANKTDPQTIAAMLPFFNTVAWLWAGIGLTAATVAVAARHGTVPKWIGRFSAVIAALIAVTQAVPLQYLAGLAGAVWLTVVSIGFAATHRS